MKNSLAKNLAYSGMLAALLVGGKLALSFLPNVEIVSALVILATALLGLRVSLPAVLVFCAIDTLVFGFYPIASTQYFFHFPLLCVAVWAVSKRTEGLLPLIIASFIFSLLFWVETPILNVIFKLSLFMPTLISGIPFFVAQAISSLAFTILLYNPVNKLLKKSK